MKTNDFSLKRIKLLIHRQWVLSAKSWRIAMIAATGINFAISLLILFTTQNPANTIQSFKVSMLITFSIMGAVFTSEAFKELKEPNTSVTFLTLPASIFEKFLTAWLFTFPVYFILSYIVYRFSILLLYVIAKSFFVVDFSVGSESWSIIGTLFFIGFIVHAVFFLGASWFKKLSFFKTLLVLFSISILHNLWLYIWGRLLLPVNDLAEKEFAFNGIVISNPESFVLGIKIFMLVVAIMCLITAYFKLKEREG